MKTEDRSGWVGIESVNDKSIAQQAFSDLRRRAVAEPQPYRLGRRAEEKSQVVKVGILGDDCKAVLFREVPDLPVRSGIQSYQCHMCGTRKDVTDRVDQNARDILVKQQFQYQAPSSRRSRSAAKAKLALISSGCSSGKSAMISASVIPDAR